MNRRARRRGAKPPRGANRAGALSAAHHAFQSGHRDEATRRYERILATHPGQPDALHMLGVIAHLAGDHERAATLISRAVRSAPAAAPFHHNLAEAYRALGKLDRAVEAERAALRANPDYAAARNGLGAALFKLGRVAEAIPQLEAAVTIDRAYAPAHINLGVAAEETGHPGRALRHYERAAELTPDHPALQTNLANALLKCGDARGALDALRDSAAASRPTAEAGSNLLLALNYLPHDPAAVFDEHRAWDREYASGVTPLPPPSPAHAPNRRLRIGYLTPDLHRHSVGYFFQPLLEAHDRDAVEVFCYTDTAKERGAADWLRALPDHWRDITPLSDEDAARRIREDGVDILVDLAGHTAHHRLLVLPYRPAPIQATYCGYANTTGMDSVDYRITDAWADPPGTTEQFHSETLVRLPGGFLCYAPDPEAPEPAETLALHNGYVTFGTFNHLPKITPEVVATWARILAAVPGSRFFSKAMAYEDKRVKERVRGAFVEHGIAPERIELHSWTPSYADHLRLYERIDIGLDTFPYAGTTTTCETLWMGVPVVSLAGRTHVTRVGVSLLNQIGLPELAAADEAAYVDTAVALASDVGRLAELRRTIRPRMAASPLRDPARLAREMEASYRTMWRTYLACDPRAAAPAEAVA